MQSHNYATGFLHQSLRNLYGLPIGLLGCYRQSWVNGCCAVSKMCGRSRAESLLATLQEVVPSSAVDVNVDASGDDVVPLCVDYIVALRADALSRNGGDAAIAERYGAARNPSVGSEYVGICDVYEHITVLGLL